MAGGARPQAAGGARQPHPAELDALRWAWLYRGAAASLGGDFQAAAGDLGRFLALEPRSSTGLLLAGLAAEKRRAPRTAARFYERAAKAHPTCAAASLLAARLRGRGCDAAFDAEPDYAHIALFQYEPGQSWGRYLEGLLSLSFDEKRALALCVRFGREDTRFSPYHFETVKRAERMSRAHPKKAWSAALLGRALSRCPKDDGRTKESLVLLGEAVRRAPRCGWPYAWRALARLQARQTPAALADLDAGLRLQPYYYRAYGWRGALLRRLGRLPEALRDLDRAVAVDERYPFSLHERSLARRAAGDFVGAALDLDRAFALDFRYSWVHTTGREPSAEESALGLKELDRAVAAHPSAASLLVWRGRLRLQRREFAEAFRDLLAASRLDPHHAPALAWQGVGLLESGQPARAAVLLERAGRLEPSMLVFRCWLAEAQRQAGQPAAALKMLDLLLRARPKAWWGHLQKARHFLEEGQAKKALPCALRAMALEGRDVEGYHLEARIRLALGDLKGAEAAVERALTISPNLGRLYVLRAAVRQRQGRFDGVLQDYRTVCERFPYLFNEEERGRVAALLGKTGPGASRGAGPC